MNRFEKVLVQVFIPALILYWLAGYADSHPTSLLSGPITFFGSFVAFFLFVRLVVILSD